MGRSAWRAADRGSARPITAAPTVPAIEEKARRSGLSTISDFAARAPLLPERGQPLDLVRQILVRIGGLGKRGVNGLLRVGFLPVFVLHAGLQPERAGVLGDGQGLVEPHLRIVHLPILVGEVGGAQRQRPARALDAGDGLLGGGHRLVRRLRVDGERDGDVLPADDDLRRVGGHLRNLEPHPLAVFGLLRLGRDGEHVLRCVVGEGAPLLGLRVEDDLPFVLARDGEERVGALLQRLAVDDDVVAEVDGRGLVRAGAPDRVVRNERAPDGPPLHAGTAVLEADVDQTDGLRQRGVGADAGETKLLRGERQREQSDENTDEQFAHGSSVWCRESYYGHSIQRSSSSVRAPRPSTISTCTSVERRTPGGRAVNARMNRGAGTGYHGWFFVTEGSGRRKVGTRIAPLLKSRFTSRMPYGESA